MKCAAVEIASPGGPDALRLCERELADPSDGQVIIRVEAAGVNRPDVVQRQGHYAPPPGTTDIPGLEVAGEIIAVGPNVARWKTGDRVCALVTGGGYADHALADALLCLPIPTGFSAIEAASLPETMFTVWSNIVDQAGLKPGARVLVHGGSGGIGITAIQMVHALGGIAYATAGSAEKVARCVDFGAERAINYREEDFVEVIQAITEKRGVDIILDMVAGDYLMRNEQAAAVGGRIVMIGFMEGGRPKLDVWNVMRKRLIVTGSLLRPRPLEEKALIAQAVETNLWPKLKSGAIRAVIDRVFPLEQAAAAHAHMEGSAHIGKIMLVP